MDTEFYRSAVARQFPSLDLSGWRLLGEGGVCYVFETDGGLAWRFLKQPAWQAGLEVEIRLLPELAPALALAIPRYAYVSDPAIWPRFVGYTKIEGEPLTRARLAACGDDRPVRQLAQFLTQLHRFPVERAQALGLAALTPEQRRAERIEWNEKIGQHVLPLLDERQRARGGQVMSEFTNDDTLLDYTPALCHSDLWAEHVLFNAQSGELAGVIDWESACLGDPAGDWAALWLEHGEDVVERVLAYYAGPVNATLRRRVRRLASCVPLNEILCGVLYDDRASWEDGWARLAQA